MSFESIPRAGVKLIRRTPPALLLVASSLLAQQASPSLYTDLGPHHKAVGTRVPAAQQYFDQGLRLVYGFNHAEAIRSFTRATELDPACAMCWWGIAYAYGPHVNAGMDSASGVKAYEAAQKALALSAKASPWERRYIRAVAARYARVPPANRASLEDLKRFPENGWSLFGLAAALRAQGKSADAAAVDQRFAKAWSASDVKLIASRF